MDSVEVEPLTSIDPSLPNNLSTNPTIISHHHASVTKHVQDNLQVNGATLVCEECGKSFKRRSYLRYHKRTQHDPNCKEFDCPNCNVKFIVGKSFLLHYYQNHMNTVKLPFDLEQLIVRGKVDDKNVSGGPDLSTICGICGKVYKDKHSLKRHQLKEHEAPDLRYPCPDCGKDFKDKDWLTAHRKKVHLGEFVTRCNICDKDQATEGKLWRHRVDVHGMGGEEAAEGLASVKWVQCTECGELFTRGKQWNGHLKTKHKGGEQWRKLMEEEKLDTLERNRRRKREARRRLREEGIGPEWLKKELKERGKERSKVVGEGVGGYKCNKEGCGKFFTKRCNFFGHLMETHFDLDKRIAERRIFEEEEIEEWKRRKVLRCTLCGEVIRHAVEVKVHVVRDHPDVYKSIVEGAAIKIKCPMDECEEEMEGVEEVRKHLGDKHEDDCWRCPECEKVILSPEEMERHWKKEHGEEEDVDGREEEEVRMGMWDLKGCSRKIKRRKENKMTDGGIKKRRMVTNSAKNIGNKWHLRKINCEICGIGLTLGSYGKHLLKCHGLEERMEWVCEFCGEGKKPLRRRECWLAHLEWKHGSQVDMEEMLEKGRKMNVEGGVEGLDPKYRIMVKKKVVRRRRKRGKTKIIGSKEVVKGKKIKLSVKLEEMRRDLEKEKRLIVGPLHRVKTVRREILYLDVNS